MRFEEEQVDKLHLIQMFQIIEHLYSMLSQVGWLNWIQLASMVNFDKVGMAGRPS